MAPDIQKNIGIPIVHIVDETLKKIQEKGLTSVALLGTQFTMEQDFFKERLIRQGIEVLVPGKEDREFVHRAIFTELFSHITKDQTKARFLEIVDSLQKQEAQGLILGCTELPLLLHPEDFSIPVFDTTEIHSKAAVELALEEEGLTNKD
jgi:aspartate racemase